MRNLLIVFSFVVAASCSPKYLHIPSFDPSPDFVLAEFWFNGSSKNNWILDRIPDYGDGRSEGCVVEAQIRLSLTQNSALSEKFAGVVEDAKTNERMNGATITLKNSKGKVLQTFSSDKNGEFETVIDQDIKRIEVLFIGYRTLVVDLRK